MIDVATGDLRRVSGRPGQDEVAIAWSPDGTRLAYLWYDGTARRLMVAPVPGSPVDRSVLTGPVAESMAWSPDGAAIVYATGTAIATIDAGLATNR